MPNSLAIKAPNFGAWLKLQRTDRKWSHGEIANKVRYLVRASGEKVSPSQIVAYEKGRVPPWHMLAALCRVYDADIRTVVLTLIETLEFPGASDLLRPLVGVQPASDATPEDLPTEARTHVPLVAASSSPDSGRAESVIVNAVTVAVRLTEVSEQLRDLADAITGRQVAAIGALETAHAQSDRTPRRRAAGK